MPRIAHITTPQYPHHITKRGNNRTDVFFDDEDEAVYLSFLNDYCNKWSVEIWAYCLMTNHLHILAVPATCKGGRCSFRSESTFIEWKN